MRSFVVMLLTGLLFACPLLCGADEIGHGAQHETAASDASHDHSTEQCPESADSCVCRGAVQLNNARLNVQVDVVVGLLVYLPYRFVLASPTDHLSLGGSPTGLASWGGSLTIRAYLQNFRF